MESEEKDVFPEDLEVEMKKPFDDGSDLPPAKRFGQVLKA